jgi:dolichol kinase
LKDPEDPEVQSFSRSCSPTELLFGPAQYALVLIILGLYRFKSEEAAVLIAALVGDVMAPVIGAIFGRHDYQMPFSSQKTMEGSLCGVFLGTCSSVYFFLYCFGLQLLPLRVVLAYAGIAAVVEGSAPASMDNLAVPLILTLSKNRVRSFLGTFIGETLVQSLQAETGSNASAAAAVSSTLGDLKGT